ncbi:hypothetical protein CYMTET_20221 [Cymbomonas tetramitiformis]|uniref:Uncharacterized protein n=1 Tax=Cymbomonas tetramitiformis TaxID=36881 RepID=A0AAE0G4M8_9CHLO|nr:hypothetical protein CYMTET_20221 [Cymbomonas tetramitiformis]
MHKGFIAECDLAFGARRALSPLRTLELHRVDNLCIIKHAPEPTNGALSPRGLRKPPILCAALSPLGARHLRD